MEDIGNILDIEHLEMLRNPFKEQLEKICLENEENLKRKLDILDKDFKKKLVKPDPEMMALAEELIEGVEI